MEQQAEVLPIKQGILLDVLDQQHPALSSSSDYPVVETKPDATPEKVAEAAPEEAEHTEESATPATEIEQPGADPEVKKPPKGVQKRLDELTKQREQERARAEAAEKRLDEALKLAQKPEPKAEVVEETDAPVRPSRSDFTDDDAFYSAQDKYADERATFIAKREIKRQQEELQKTQTENAIAEGQKIARDAYLGRVQKTQEQYADFKEVAESPDVTVSIPMAHAIVHHEQGPSIQYYLGKNPDEASRISKLDVPSQLVELGVIVATKLAAPTVNEPKPKPVSAAPKPISQTKVTESVAVKDPSNMSMDEYAAWRKRERH